MTPETEKLVLETLDVLLERVYFTTPYRKERERLEILRAKVGSRRVDLAPPSDAPLTVESVYGKPQTSCRRPDGFLFTGEFRDFEDMEWFLEPGSERPNRIGGPIKNCPRLILRPAKKLVFDILDENAYANHGQLCSHGSTVYRHTSRLPELYRYILSESRVEEG